MQPGLFWLQQEKKITGKSRSRGPVRRPLDARRGRTVLTGPGSRRGDGVGLAAGHVLKVKLRGFAGELNVGCTGKRGAQDDSEIFDFSFRKDKVARC